MNIEEIKNTITLLEADLENTYISEATETLIEEKLIQLDEELTQKKLKEESVK